MERRCRRVSALESGMQCSDRCGGGDGVCMHTDVPATRPLLANRTEATTRTRTHTHRHPFNGPLSGTTQVKLKQTTRHWWSSTTCFGVTNHSEARNSEWQWHQLCHMQVCTSLQADNHASTPPLSFLQAGCCIRALKCVVCDCLVVYVATV